MEVLTDTYRKHQVVLKLSDREVSEFLGQLDWLISMGAKQTKGRDFSMLSDLYNSMYELEE